MSRPKSGASARAIPAAKPADTVPITTAANRGSHDPARCLGVSSGRRMAPQGYQPPGAGSAVDTGAVGRSADVVVVGAGAAGLFAATFAARAQRAAGRAVSVLALDGARRIGAKILVSGGGRCNVTHWQVGAADYAGSTAPAIRRQSRDSTEASFTLAFVSSCCNEFIVSRDSA